MNPEKRDDWQTAVALLAQDPERNVNILNFIADYPPTGCETAGRSLLVRGVSDRPWVLIAAASEAELRQLVQKLRPEDDHFAAVESWMIPIISAGRKMAWDLHTTQYILPADAPLQRPSHPHHPLHPDDAEHVFHNSDYRDYLTVAYLRDRITRGPSAGIYEANLPVAWALTQDDGAVGGLHVLPGHRQKGYGSQVTLALCHTIRQQGKLPFACIKPDNHKAINLIKKLGFVAQKEVHWFQLV